MLSVSLIQHAKDFLHFWWHNILVSWEIGHGIFGIIEGMSVIGAAALRFRSRPKNREKWEDFTMKTAVVLLFGSFLVSVVFVAPFIQYETKPAPLQLAQATPPPIQLDVREHGVDQESRQKIQSLEKELEEARSNNDPLSKPIAAARFTAIVRFEDKKENPARYMAVGSMAALAVGNTAILYCRADDHDSDGNGQSTFVGEAPFNSIPANKPIRELSKAKNVILAFAPGFMPTGTKISGGSVIFVINNQVRLSFEIPEMKIHDTVNGEPAIVLGDIQKGLEPILNLPSPTPDKGASPP